ncbi:MAG: type I restriction-modification system subunit M [Spirochaetes bacterium GWF1_31_7]|nr:MAG: type I restriction-modification system subunit M [Spirochaetes bacterium GWE1_32_154]OHD46639.1 MAG: type I restriction-modification system subunit M [Spirochaetes bacterium GWF1_31_7]OHD52604.1 MAG: type I restriction-modification system subunit M [Spirochaetes bacterium GWE2_31_10]HBI36006.1 type I restriction-modification system subunit M [Spirochaetia bacterium]
MNKQQLAARIWESANQMRSKIDANEYKDYILGFIFYKYLSDKELQFAKKEDFTDEDIKALSEEDAETLDHIKNNIGYFIAHKDLFSTWIKMGKDFDVSNVRDALSAFSRLISPAHKKLFDGVFDTLQTGLSKLGDSAASQTKAISELIHLIKDIPMDGKQDYDVLGFIYEYLISMFAANAGKKAGEFYTPHEVSLLMSEIVADHLKDKKEIQIYDPTSGSGSLLINIGSCVARHIDDENNIKYYAQELKKNTYNLTRMNLVMRGMLPNNIVTRNGDTLEDDWPYFDENDPVNSYNPLYVDAVVSNPPYSQQWDYSNKETDPRYARFGIAPKTKADYAFLLHDLFHIKPDGIMTIVLPHGVLFRGGEEGAIRKNLIEANHIDTVIGLPANIFFGTGIPTVIMVLKQKRENTDVLIVDASKGFIKVGKNNKLRASDIKRIADTVINRQSHSKYSKVVSRDELRENDYNLNIPRYVDSSEKAESWDIYSSMFGGIPENEIDELKDFWTSFPNLRNDLFSNTDTPYVELKVKDVKSIIKEHLDVKGFVNSFNSAFGDFNDILKKELLTNMDSLNISKEETVISEDIFKRLKTIPLIDKYEAYQLLDDDWTKIAVDLEIIQTEGFDTTKKVDPNLINKKKDSKDQEVQEGWLGHIIPFELVQETYLKEEHQKLKYNESRLLEITAEYEEILDSLCEEEKESDAVNDAKDSFVNAGVAKEAKQIKADMKNGSLAKDSYEAKIVKVSELFIEEKELKKQLVSENAKLHQRTKETIENLTDEQVFELLELKWIRPLITSLKKLPKTVINELSAKVQVLADKYATTYMDVVKEINETENILSSLIDELTGNDYDMKGLSEFQKLLKGE